MKLMSSDFKHGEAKVKVENSDDLWYLSQIIDEDDIIKGKTLRKIKVSGEEKEAVRKPVFLALQAEKIEFTAAALRVNGKILEGPEDVPRGSYHTFNIEEGTSITIIKEKWLGYQIDRLKEACQAKMPKILICVFDREDAFFALMKRAGYDLISQIKGSVAKKGVEGAAKGDFYSEIIKQLEEYNKRYDLDKIILASPSFWKEELFKVLRNDELKKKILPATCSSADRSAIDEVLKREEVRKVLQEERVSKEIALVEELLTEISKQGLAAYGLDETEQAANLGAIRDLLVTDSLIAKSREEGTFSRLEALMRLADGIKAKITVISSEHVGGKKLDGLGGVGAILRFKLHY
ncbi:MAG: mRNA surveillance protein pelota [Candidatus Woesearchaeota archaeon]